MRGFRICLFCRNLALKTIFCQSLLVRTVLRRAPWAGSAPLEFQDLRSRGGHVTFTFCAEIDTK
jgi:hypothetical protein